MAQTSVSRSPSYERKARLVRYPSAMPEQRSRIQQVNSTMRSNKRDMKPGISRLELMRNNYEKKLLKEKEQRLTEIRNQNKERLRSGGTVREFFAERRAMEASAKGKKNSSALPPIDLHFKQMKEQKQREISSDSLYHNRAFQNQPSPQMTASPHGKNVEVFSPQSHKTQNISQPRSIPGQYIPPKKRSTGVDKQNPLPPLHPGKSNSHQPPTPNKRYETHANLENYDKPLYKTSNLKRKKHVPRTLNKQPDTLVINRAASNSSFYNEDDDDENDFMQEESPPPNLSKVKALRNKRLSQQKLLTNTVSKERKLTDFEKWQIEQDNARKQRLDRYKKELSSDSCDEDDSVANDDLAKQEKELLELINAEKNKLQQIQKQREEIDEQERLEREQEEQWEKQNDQYFKYNDDIKMLVSDTDVTEDEQELQKSFATSKLKHKKSLQNRKISSSRAPHNPENSIKAVQGSSIKFYEQKALEASKGEDDVNHDLSSCAICGRKFATERLSKHEKVCEKFSRKKRKKFDTRKQRAQGQDHEQYVRDGRYKLEPEKKAKKKNWRAQHENFIATIRYAKGSSDVPPPPTENPDYEQCPYCERKFNAAAAERHIPRCKDIKSRTAARTKKKR